MGTVGHGHVSQLRQGQENEYLLLMASTSHSRLSFPEAGKVAETSGDGWDGDGQVKCVTSRVSLSG